MANEKSELKFVYVTYIATTPEKLWEVLTSGEFTKQYFFAAPPRAEDAPPSG